MIDIGKKLVKIIVEHNTSRFIGRLAIRGTERWNNARLHIYPNHLSSKLKYREKLGLNRRIKFVCIAMCSLVMNLCLHDLHVTSLNNIEINSGLTYTVPGFWMVKHQFV